MGPGLTASGPERSARRPLRNSGTGRILAFSRVLDALIFSACFIYFWKDLAARSVYVLTVSTLIVPASMALYDYFGLYESHRLHGVSVQLRQLLSAQLFGGAIMTLGAFLLAGKAGLPRAAYFLVCSTALLAGEKIASRALLIRIRRRGLDHRNVAFIGDWQSSRETAAEFATNAGWGLRMAVVGTGEPMSREFIEYDTGQRIAGNLEEAFRKAVVDEVWIGVPFDKLAAERETIASCDRCGLLCRLLVFSPVQHVLHADLSDHNGALSLGIGGLGHSDTGMAIKRFLDLLIASVLLVLFAPVMLAAALLVKLSSPGPVFFHQSRAGLRGRRFRMIKFRTMIDGAESMAGAMQDRNITRGPVFKDPDDWRITPIGRVLRRFSIDELPQLWNVLRGEMSMVGPRPLPLYEADRIDGMPRKRFSMRPGLTCLWQVQGRSSVEYSQWMTYDLQYVEGWSLWLDLVLILKTVPIVLTGRGAY